MKVSALLPVLAHCPSSQLVSEPAFWRDVELDIMSNQAYERTPSYVEAVKPLLLKHLCLRGLNWYYPYRRDLLPRLVNLESLDVEIDSCDDAVKLILSAILCLPLRVLSIQYDVELDQSFVKSLPSSLIAFKFSGVPAHEAWDNASVQSLELDCSPFPMLQGLAEGSWPSLKSLYVESARDEEVEELHDACSERGIAFSWRIDSPEVSYEEYDGYDDDDSDDAW